jgi:hypothetical protein
MVGEFDAGDVEEESLWHGGVVRLR